MAQPLSRKMDCGELLVHVQNFERSLPELADECFGHPPPPNLFMTQVPLRREDSELFFVTAQTKRCLSAQLWIAPAQGSGPLEHPACPVMDIYSPPQPGHDDSIVEDGIEETISCAIVLALDPSLNYGEDQDVLTNRQVVVAFGTNYSRVLSLEFTIQVCVNDGKLAVSMSMNKERDKSAFELLPLDPPERIDDYTTGDSLNGSRHGMRSTSMHGRSGTDWINSSIHGLSSRRGSLDLSIQERSRTDSFSTSMHGRTRRSSLDSLLHGPDTKDPLATSRHGNKEMQRDGVPKLHVFRPKGGVVSMSAFQLAWHEWEPTTFVWISYRDGTTVRVHHASFFPSIVKKEAFHDFLASAVLRSRVALPPSAETEGVIVVPLPKYHPSPLAPLPPWKPLQDDADAMETPASTVLISDDEDRDEEEQSFDTVPEFHEALVIGGVSSQVIGDNFPTLAFYTSENQFAGRVTGDVTEGQNGSSSRDSALLNSVIGGTKTLVRGVLGTALGVVKWGFLGRSDKSAEQDVPVQEPSDVDIDGQEFLSPMFPALHVEPTNIFAGFEMHDAPRQVTFVSIDPDGNLAATADTLGRVLLLDLSTKQVVRMWKGVRDASCYWIEVPRTHVERSWQKNKLQYLVIHSKQRRVVEIWRTRHGPRVKSMQVARDAQLIQCQVSSNSGSFASCYLLHSCAAGTLLNQMELLSFDDEAKPSARKAIVGPSSTKGISSTSLKEAAMRLQLLQQLLAKTNVPCERQDVFEALTQITTLKDLCTALDVLAVANQLEDRMGVNGAEFHAVAVAHCKRVLEGLIRDGGRDAIENTHVKLLTSKIAYHEQLIEAYEVIHEFEVSNVGVNDEDEQIPPKSPWAVEAMAWMTTYETVSGSNIDADITKASQDRLRFASFANACSDSKGELHFEKGKGGVHKIYLSDSTKTRKEILVHFFRPLLGDIFSFSVVNATFDCMGIMGDSDYLLKCFGEWFMSIPARESARKSFFVLYSPMMRWLQDMVLKELDSTASREEAKREIVLGALHRFCAESADLVRSFLLAALCREAVAVATRKKEAKTYGKISSTEAVKEWNTLLRRLRMCLLVTLRLNGLTLGPFPITIANVEAGDIFSVYEWLARDELKMSHKQEELVALEKACSCSGLVFDPSTEMGDNPSRWKTLQQACLVGAISEEEREEYLLDMNDDDQLGALLLYLSSHNSSGMLAAHRALLLGSDWVKRPSDLEILGDCLEALKALAINKKHKSLSAAVCLEVWQSAIRPIYRAVLFGFDDVHELSEEIVAPLLTQKDFIQGLGQLSLQLLELLSNVAWDDTMNTPSFVVPGDNTGWPPVKDDFILKRLVQKSQRIDSNALAYHRGIICGTMVSGNTEALSECISNIDGIFLRTSLFELMGPGMGIHEKQMDYLEQAVIIRAFELDGSRFLDRFDLGEIDTLAQLWDVDIRDVRTLFLLVMYELGKDQIVDDLVTLSTSRNIHVDRLVQDGWGIACRRLHRAMNLKRSPQLRSIMGMLDAQTCEWVRETAETTEPLFEDDDDFDVPMASTHLLILRLLSLASMMGDNNFVVKIHALSILSGTLMMYSE